MARFPEENEITKALRALDWLWDLLHRMQQRQPAGPCRRTRKHDLPKQYPSAALRIARRAPAYPWDRTFFASI